MARLFGSRSSLGQTAARHVNLTDDENTARSELTKSQLAKCFENKRRRCFKQIVSHPLVHITHGTSECAKKTTRLQKGPPNRVWVYLIIFPALIGCAPSTHPVVKDGGCQQSDCADASGLPSDAGFVDGDAGGIEVANDARVGEECGVCEFGFVATPDCLCVDVDECVTGNGGCEELCVNTEGSFHCELDNDGDGIANNEDNCWDVANVRQDDADNCPMTMNPEQLDEVQDGVRDVCAGKHWRCTMQFQLRFILRTQSTDFYVKNESSPILGG